MRLLVISLMIVGCALGCKDDEAHNMTDETPIVDLGLDARVDPTPDLGDDCILVRNEAGEWVPDCRARDQGIPLDASATPSLRVTISSPMNGESVDEGVSVVISGSVSAENLSLSFVALEVSVPTGEVGGLIFERQNGQFQATVSGLPPGENAVRVTARAAPDIEVVEEITLNVNCGFATSFNDTLDPGLWTVLGSARLDEGGWLEMSNNQTSTSGGIFLTGRTINPGEINMSFRISSGSGQCPVPEEPCLRGNGTPQEVADGFAVTFWNVGVGEVDELWDLLCRCGSGAILSGATTDTIDPADIPEGITIEFDTYPNYCPNNGFYDPIQQPHVEILQNGRFYRGPVGLTREERCMLTDFAEEEGITWAAYPDLVNNYWHDVNLLIRDGRVQVTINDDLILDAELPDFRFKGGVLAFSGGSGAVSSYQRFDELVIQSGCQ